MARSTLTPEQIEQIRNAMGIMMFGIGLFILLTISGLYLVAALSLIICIISLIIMRSALDLREFDKDGFKIEQSQTVKHAAPAPEAVRKTTPPPPPPPPKLKEFAKPAVEIDWEQWMGTKLLQKVGIAVVLVGMVVFLKYSFDNRLIGELGRIALSVIGAAALLVAGEWFRSKYENWSQAFIGGGIALLYFTVWAAHVFYAEQLNAIHGISISPTFALVLHSGITLLGVLAAIRYNAQTIAWFSVAGGYITPILIDSPAPNYAGLTAYIAILTAGLLVLAWHRKWDYINIAAFILTQLYLFQTIYKAPLDAIDNVQQFTIAVVFFFLFGGIPLVQQLRQKLHATGEETALIIGNGVLAFFAVLDSFGSMQGEYLSLISFGFAAIYLVFGSAAINRIPGDNRIVNVYLVASVVLTALALYADLKLDWVVVGWAPFATLLAFMSVKIQKRGPWNCALTLLALSGVVLLANATKYVEPSTELLWQSLTSAWSIQSYVFFVCLIIWAKLTSYLPKSLVEKEDTRNTLLLSIEAAIALFLFAWVTLEATALEWVIDLPLAFAYLALSVGLLAIYVFVPSVIWLVTAFILQALILLFTFTPNGVSSMALATSSSSAPILNAWAAVSMVSFGIFLLMAYLVPTSKPRGVQLPEPAKSRMFFISIALAQVLMHVTVELQHMQAAYNWTHILFERVFTGWWVIFAVTIIAWGLKRNSRKIVQVAVALLFVTLSKDVMRMMQGSTDFYEVIFWTCIPIATIFAGCIQKKKDLILGGMGMLVATVATDMVLHLSYAGSLLRTIWWAITGLVIIVQGFAYDQKDLRKFALIIFGATVCKLLFIDFSNLTTGVRIGASILTGLLLIGASYLYQRFDNSHSQSK